MKQIPVDGLDDRVLSLRERHCTRDGEALLAIAQVDLGQGGKLLQCFVRCEFGVAQMITKQRQEQMSVKDGRADADSIGYLKQDVGAGPGPQDLL